MWPRTSKQEEGGRSVLERQAGVRSVIPMEADIAIVHLGCLLECKYAQSCLTLCDPTDCSLPGSSVLGISQARMLGWVAISYTRGSSRPWD